MALGRWLASLWCRRHRLPTVSLPPYPQWGEEERYAMENILSNHDFSQGLSSWRPNGCDAFVAPQGGYGHHGVMPQSGASYAVVTRRTHSWQGLEQDITAKVVAGTTYTVVAFVRVHGQLQEAMEVQATLKIEREGASFPEYLSVARTSASQERWEKLEGTFELKTIPRRVVFYFQGPPPEMDLLIDSVTISYKKTEKATSQIGGPENIISNYNFSQGLHPWHPICCHAYVASQWSGFLNGIKGNSGENYAVVTKRTESWHGLEQDITGKVYLDTTYAVSAYVRCHGNIKGQVEVKATLRLHDVNNSTCYIIVGSVFASKEKWEKLEGFFSLTKDMPKRAIFYFEGPPASVDLLIDSVTIACSGHTQSKMDFKGGAQARGVK